MTSPAFRLASSSLLALILMTAQSTCAFAAEITLEKETAVVGTAAETKSEKSDVAPAEVKDGVTVKGTVESNVALPDATVESIIKKLALSARKNNEDLGKAQTYVDKYGTFKSHATALGSDALNSIFMFKGVSQSSQAGDVILDEKLKLNSLGAAKLSMRKIEDDIETKLLTKILDLAGAVGTRDQAAIDEATSELKAFAGEDETKDLINALSNFGDQDLTENSDFALRTAKSSEISKRVNLAVRSAALTDEVVDEIKADLHKYNRHRPGTMAFHRVARTTLSVIGCTPNIIGPASQVVLFGYVMASGGTETSKVVKEIYMGKRLEVRAATLREEIHTLFNAYQSAVSNKNAVLAGAARELLSHKIGASNAAALLRFKDISDVSRDIETKTLAAAERAKEAENAKARKNSKNVTASNVKDAKADDSSKAEEAKSEEAKKAESKTESRRDRKASSKSKGKIQISSKLDSKTDRKSEIAKEAKSEAEAETKSDAKDAEAKSDSNSEAKTERKSKSENDSTFEVL